MNWKIKKGHLEQIITSDFKSLLNNIILADLHYTINALVEKYSKSFHLPDNIDEVNFKALSNSSVCYNNAAK